jgi:hypothetical protein
VAEIPLHNRVGDVVAATLVDDADLPLLAGRKWQLWSNGYVARYIDLPSGRILQRMHRVLMGLDNGDPRRVDHRNRNKLDNRRSNLRIATPAQNSQNMAVVNNRGASRYRGVTWYARTGRWQAKAKLNGRRLHLGYFLTEEEAMTALESWRAGHQPFAPVR